MNIIAKVLRHNFMAMPGYRIVPPEVGDTMALPAAYSLFRKDVAEMLDRVYK